MRPPSPPTLLLPLVLGCALALGACSSRRAGRLANGGLAPAESSGPGDEVKTFIGLLRARDGAFEYLICDTPGVHYTVTGEATAALLPRYEDLVADEYPGKYVVAKLTGLLPATTPARDLELREAEWLEKRNPRTACFPGELFATGNEPFWTVYVNATEGVIELERLGVPPLAFPYVEPVELDGGGARRYYAESEDDRHRLAIVVRDEACSDSMSGNRYAQTVTVELDGETLPDGCGAPR